MAKVELEGFKAKVMESLTLCDGQVKVVRGAFSRAEAQTLSSEIRGFGLADFVVFLGPDEDLEVYELPMPSLTPEERWSSSEDGK